MKRFILNYIVRSYLTTSTLRGHAIKGATLKKKNRRKLILKRIAEVSDTILRWSELRPDDLALPVTADGEHEAMRFIARYSKLNCEVVLREVKGKTYKHPYLLIYL